MFSALRRARPLIGVWAASSGIAALLIVMKIDDLHAFSALLTAHVWVATAAGVAVGCLSSPLLNSSWIRWYWGALLGLPLGAIVLFCFFFVRPHAWQPSLLDAWKSVGMFVGLYPEIIVPACIIAGALGGHLAHRLRQAHTSP